MALGGLKFLAIAMEHSTKWAEVKPFTMINRRQAEKFAWEHIVCRFGIPRTISSKKDKHFKEAKSIVPKDNRYVTKENAKRKEDKEVASIGEAYYQSKLQRYHDVRSNYSTYKLGDFVLLSLNDTKSLQMWQGPHIMSDVHEGELYKITDASDHSFIQTTKGTSLHKFYM
ncbi:reverse transcriptase domain-containing protein [Tanacetum coccineum]|uniref:Reverse transcriptase domain-containing protein n=1 Tax=Tanacetum coccineum TaxID=301880 RepID=A0ABQ5GAV3_9ASTR